MRYLKLILQLVFVFALSGVFLRWFGINYWLVAMVGATIVMLLLLHARARHLEAETREIQFREHASATFWIVLFGIVLGTFWPSVPIIVGVGKLRENGAGGVPGTKARQPDPSS